MARYKEISAVLRQRLLSGALKPGTVLPTTLQLAEQFDTSAFTVQMAVAPLVEEGLLERRRNLGTVVRHNPALLSCAGIYAGSGLLDEREFAFYRELCRQLQRQLNEADVRSVLYIDTRPREELHAPLPELVQAIDSRRAQGLFVALTDKVSSGWLRRLPVATSFVTSDTSVNPVGFDATQMVRLALRRLHEQGCRRIGAISSIRMPEDIHHPYFRFYEAFVSTIADLGLQTRDSWVISPTEPVTSRERYGYASCKALWQQAERPDGLFVYPDVAARGVTMALLELGVRVPDVLKLVCHRNSGVDWPCPLPISWVESDVARCAAEMVAQVRQLKAGGAIAPVYLPYIIRKEHRHEEQEHG